MPAATDSTATTTAATELWNHGTLQDLVGNGEVFPVLNERLYFNHAGISPIAKPVGDAVRDFLHHFERHAFVGFDFPHPIERLRRTFASVIGASPDEIALLHNTGEAISQVAFGLDWQPGDRIVTTGAEYPANLYPWMAVRDRFGVELVQVPEEITTGGRAVVSHEALLAEIAKPGTKLLAVSHVQWGSGQRMDLERLGRACREHGVLFSVDAIQSVGVLPIDVEASHID
ncbi:MAG: aminotransferase class V-fold PLP-dependent enzyme, partial [Planctomycetota bacterium]